MNTTYKTQIANQTYDAGELPVEAAMTESAIQSQASIHDNSVQQNVALTNIEGTSKNGGIQDIFDTLPGITDEYILSTHNQTYETIPQEKKMEMNLTFGEVEEGPQLSSAIPDLLTPSAYHAKGVTDSDNEQNSELGSELQFLKGSKLLDEIDTSLEFLKGSKVEGDESNGILDVEELIDTNFNLVDTKDKKEQHFETPQAGESNVVSDMTENVFKHPGEMAVKSSDQFKVSPFEPLPGCTSTPAISAKKVKSHIAMIDNLPPDTKEGKKVVKGETFDVDEPLKVLHDQLDVGEVETHLESEKKASPKVETPRTRLYQDKLAQLEHQLSGGDENANLCLTAAMETGADLGGRWQFGDDNTLL